MTFYGDIDKTCNSIAQFSQEDAATYRKFIDFTSKQLEMILAGLYSPSPSFGSFYAAFEGTAEGRELLNAMMISGNAIVNEWFKDDHTKVACNRFVSENMMNPMADGSGMNLFLFLPLCHKYGWKIAEGGSGALGQALGRCIESHGGEILVNSTVKKFKIEGGTCKGVILDSGEEILGTKAVVTNFNIMQLNEMMLGAENCPPDYLNRQKNVRRSHFQAILQSLALHEAPKYKAGAETDKAFFVEFAPDNMIDFQKEFDAYSYGEPWTKAPLSATPTRWDPSRAPAGKHTSYLYHYEPYHLANGGGARWDEIKEQVADEIVGTLKTYCTNMSSENIIGRWISTPLDFERRNPSWIGGDFNHVGSFLSQQFGNRPFAGPVSRYHLPADKLYICGPGTYPGPGVIGGGRAAVQVVMEDLGIDFDDVIDT